MTTPEAAAAGPAWGPPARRVAVSLLGLGFLMRVMLAGIPLDAPQIYTWVCAVLVTGCVGRRATWIRESARIWLPFIALILLYQFAYGLAGRFFKVGPDPVQGDRNIIGMPLHVRWPVRADEALFGGTLPTTWVQQHVDQTPVLAVLLTLVYFSHFFAAPVAAVVLWWRGSPLWKPWLGMVLGLAALGLSGYFLFPMAPPWYASEQGFITPSVLRHVGDGWSYLHLSAAEGLLGKTTAMSNPVAAMPSLHLATATLVAIVLPWHAPFPWRALAALYPAAMAFTLVYGGEHYVIDELCGLALALGIVAVWRTLARRNRHSTSSAITREP